MNQWEDISISLLLIIWYQSVALRFCDLRLPSRFFSSAIIGSSMAGNKISSRDASTSVTTTDLLNPARAQLDSFFLHHSFGATCSLVTQPLIVAVNYTSWRHAMKMSLSGKNKVGFITGKIKEPMIKIYLRYEDVITILSHLGYWILFQKILQQVLYIMDLLRKSEMNYAKDSNSRMVQVFTKWGRIL